ncbi:FlgN protein [Mariprofundus ferrinatatus]|uniref:FlgN protein n=1 Tax=Mariprofundus ferrinatatus TaxID=1921087 RepID=A0A2K8L6L8_9PROT|nr:flagellar export chaperone FlgN [Mariprofundus ferrinatatus]ATX82950.1 FlgN protein [Mariprofundus ferrinatatus]
MVMHLQTSERLQAILKEMDACIAAIEEIIPLEKIAIDQLNGEAIHQLTENRRALWQELNDCKSQCQQLFQQHDMPQESDLSQLIDTCLAEDATDLHKQRQELNVRIINISRENELNAIRLKAAVQAISSTLQGLGLQKAKTTYSQDGTL